MTEISIADALADRLRERHKGQSREELEKQIWMLELQNAALLEYSAKQNTLVRNRMKQIKRLKVNLRNQEVISARLSHEAHGG